VSCDSDIEPEDLIPEYIKAKSKLFELEWPLRDEKKKEVRKGASKASASVVAKEPAVDDTQELQLAKLKAKIDKIENDVLFDGFAAEGQWRNQRIVLEKEFAVRKIQATATQDGKETEQSHQWDKSDDGDINLEAERLAAEILAENEQDGDDDGIAGLFSSLPVAEVDEATGQSNTVINGADGSRLVIRDFPKWTGVSPMRVLEEACRARDSLVKIIYRLVSEASFANRHMLTLQWTKAQEVASEKFVPEIDVLASPTKVTYTMTGVATPDKAKSEAMIATYALFHLVSSTASAKEDKLSFRLPPVWRELYGEYAQIRKDKLDEVDRKMIKELRDLVRQRQDQELEEGAILPGFKNRAVARNQADGKESNGHIQSRQVGLSSESLRQIWAAKSCTARYQAMLVCFTF
jgi:ATP-dependent RNA helicase DHX29